MEFTVDGPSLKELTRALTCLTRFGDEVDLSCTPSQVKLSSVNSSRSAFGLFAFPREFFSKYRLTSQAYQPHLNFSVTTKALLAPLKPRNASQIETCSVELTEGDPDVIDGNESRLVIKLFCAHGVVKTHRLTYGRANALYAKANRTNCTSRWSISGKALRDLTEHFHLRTGAQSGGSDEISFYHQELNCVLKTFGGEGAADDALLSRPLSTELKVESDDFDEYKTIGDPLVSIALKELKSIIALADTSNVALDAAFTNGGEPFFITLNAESYTADFVIATTAYDSNSTTTDSSSIDRRRSESAAISERKVLQPDRSTTSATARPNQRPSTLPMETQAPLFNPPSQEQQEEDEDVDYDNLGGDEFDAVGFEELDRVLTQVENEASARAASQQPPSQQPERTRSESVDTFLVPNTSARRSESVRPRTATSGAPSGAPSGMQGIREETEGVATAQEPEPQPEEGAEADGFGPTQDSSQFGPTQVRSNKKPKWNLLPEENFRR